MLKIQVEFPDEDELVRILDRSTGAQDAHVSPVLNTDRLMEMQSLVRAIPVAPSLTRYVVRLLRATHPNNEESPEKIRRFVRAGASPRGAQAILLAARVRCALDQRLTPSVEDIRHVLKPALRHRVILNFEGEAEGIRVDQLLDQIISSTAIDS